MLEAELTTKHGLDLETDRRIVDDYLDRILSQAGSGPANEAMRYAVLSGGQRLRPLLALRTARMLGAECAGTLRAAAAVELIHCASLIVDDLPCMDDTPQRRGQPATHVAFGEPVALLAAFSLVALAARIVVDVTATSEDLVRLVGFQKRLLAALDPSQLIAGQTMDVQLTGEARARQIDRINELKTVPLFQLAVEAGMIFHPEPAQWQEQCTSLGFHFGMAYQMADDFLDGESTDRDRLEGQFRQTEAVVHSCAGNREGLEELLNYIHGKTQEENRRHR